MLAPTASPSARSNPESGGESPPLYFFLTEMTVDCIMIRKVNVTYFVRNLKFVLQLDILFSNMLRMIVPDKMREEPIWIPMKMIPPKKKSKIFK
jgi:hypothetical protein